MENKTNDDIVNSEEDNSEKIHISDQKEMREETTEGSDSENTFSKNTKQEMEIHHSHHSSHKHTVKGFIYEFLMLFLAVTAGFFVENLREYYVERHRENQYIESLVLDLKRDTTEIKTIAMAHKLQLQGIDSLLNVLKGNDSREKLGYIYYLSFKYLNNAMYFKSQTRTISQLKNSGSLRLIHNATTSDSIIDYYSAIENVEYNTDFCLKEHSIILQKERMMFDFKILMNKKLGELPKLSKSEIFLFDEKLFDTFANDVIIYYSSLQSYDALLNKSCKQATSLVKFLKKEYSIKK